MKICDIDTKKTTSDYSERRSRNSSMTTSSENSLVKIEPQSLPRSEEKSCCICFEKFPDTTEEYRLHLLMHLEAYQGKSICPICRVDCTGYERMVDHVFMVHGGVEKLICPHPTCVESFRTEKTLELHSKKHKSPPSNDPGADADDAESARREPRRRVCAFADCDAAEDPAPTFKTCLKCREEGVATPAHYCGKACQTEDWKRRHRAWHLERKQANPED